MSNQHPTQPLILQREAVVHMPSRATSHRALLVAVGATALASVLVPIAMVASHHTPSPTPPTVVTIETQYTASVQPVIAPVTASVPVSVNDAACELSAIDDRERGTAIAANAALMTDRAWRGVAASPAAYGILATWSDTELFVSRDDGDTFNQALGGPGEVGGVVIDGAGVVYAVRDLNRLGVIDSCGVEHWRALPFSGDTLAMAVGHDYLGWLGLAHDRSDSASVVLAISSDGGHTWRTQTIAAHADRALLRMEAGGAVHMLLLEEDSASPTMRRLLANVDGRTPETMTWPTDFADAWGLGHDGWAYAVASECVEEHSAICAVGPTASSPLTSTGMTTAWDIIVNSNGTRTFAVSGDQLLRFDRDRITAEAQRIPVGVTTLAVDGLGRVVVSVGQHLMRLSPNHGWRVLFTRDGQIHHSERHRTIR